MNMQQVFDKVYDHLTEQGVRSVSVNGKCMYRGIGDKSCAIGCLIEDEDAKKMDGFASSSITYFAKFQKELLPCWMACMNKTYLSELQFAHDGPLKISVSKFQKEMEKIAKEYKLKGRENV